MQEPRDLRADIERLGLTQWGLARIMQQHGDDRDHHNILRHIQRVVAGERRYNGELRVVMRLLEERMQNTPVGNIRRATRPASPATHAAASPARQNP
jgi:hypothetical protein